MKKEFRINIREEVIPVNTNESFGDELLVAGCIISDKGSPSPEIISSPDELVAKYTLSGQLDKSSHPSLINAYYLLRNCSMLLVRSVNSRWVNAVTSTGKVVPINLSNGIKALKTTEVEISSFSDALVINGLLFYKDNLPSPLPAGVIVKYKFTDLTDLMDYVNSSNLGILITKDSSKLKVSSNIYPIVTDGTSEIGTQGDSIDISGDAFLVHHNELGGSTGHKIKISDKDSEKVFQVTWKGESYPASLDETKVSKYGVPLFIEELNSPDLGFKIEVINPKGSMTPGEYTFGEVIGYSKESSESVKSINTALSRLLSSDELVDAYADLGIQNTSVHNTLNFLATKKFSIAELSIPTELQHSEVLMAQFRNASGIDNTYARYLAPNDVITDLTGFKTEIAASTKAIFKIALNKSQRSEMAPLMGPNNSAIQMVNPTAVFSDNQRAYLLNNQINVIHKFNGTYFVNDNYVAALNMNSVLSEEQNRRLFSKIAREVKVLMLQFIGRNNDPATRLDVTSALDIYFANYIMNQHYKPEAIKIICDKSNNPDELVRRNKLQVTIKARLKGAIKEVNVLNEAYAIGVEFK